MQRSLFFHWTLFAVVLFGAVAAAAYISPEVVRAEEDFRSLKKEYERAKKDLSRTGMKRAIQSMAGTNDPKACEYLLDELEDDQKARKRGRPGLPGDIRDAIVEALSRFTDPDSVEKIGEMALDLKSDRDPTLALDQFDFFKALAGMDSIEAADETIRKALADEKNAYVKCAALEAIRQTESARFLEDVVAILYEDNEDWSKKWLVVPINVLACIEDIVEPEETEKVINVVNAVIAWEERKWCLDERVRFFGGKMLNKLTGETADMGALHFWKWWVAQMETVGAVDTSKKPKGERSKTAAVPPVFDSAPVGKRFVFVIDVSLSMELPLKISLEGIEERREKRGPVSGKRKGESEEEVEEEEDDDPLRQLPWKDIGTRIELAREELARAIESFVGDRMFAIVVYSTEVEVITDGWVQATPSNCSKWARKAKELEPEALTNIHGGLKKALEISDKSTSAKHPEVDENCVLTGADTIIFLTDGWASWSDDSTSQDREDPRGGGGVIGDGDFIMGDEIWPDIVRMNLFRKVIINCVGIGNHDKDLLKNLARRTGGTYVDWYFPD